MADDGNPENVGNIYFDEGETFSVEDDHVRGKSDISGFQGADAEAEGVSSEIDYKRNKRIQKIQGKLKKPLNKIGFKRSVRLLSELRELQGSDDLEILLQMADCELQRARGKREESIQRTKDFISASGLYRTEDVNTIAEALRMEECYIHLLILYRISNDFNKPQNVSPDDAVTWIRNRILDLSIATLPLIVAGGRSRDIGIKYGLVYMESLRNDLRKIENATPNVKALNEAECLDQLITCNDAREYKMSFRFGSEGVQILEKQFGGDASKYKIYGRLLNRLGIAYHFSGHHSDAERYCVRAIEAYEKASDIENEGEKLDYIEKTKRSLAKIRRLIDIQK